MKPNTEIPKMEPFLSTEDRMGLIVNILKEFRRQKIKSPEFMDLYHLKNNELVVLLNVVSPNRTTVIDNEDEDGDPIDDIFDDGWIDDSHPTRNERLEEFPF